VAGPGTTFSAPSITVNGNSVNIVAVGPDHSLRFYWAAIGTGTWHLEFAAGVDTTFSVPALTSNDAAANISAVGPGGQLFFYFAIDGTDTWTAITIAGLGSVR
jgi:hypothetical protein